MLTKMLLSKNKVLFVLSSAKTWLPGSASSAHVEKGNVGKVSATSRKVEGVGPHDRILEICQGCPR